MTYQNVLLGYLKKKYISLYQIKVEPLFKKPVTNTSLNMNLSNHLNSQMIIKV